MHSDGRKSSMEEEATTSRAREILEAYGARFQNWPDLERAAVLTRVEADAALAAARREQDALDEALGALGPVSAPATLAVRLLDDFDTAMERRRSQIWPRIRAVAEALGYAMWPGAPLWQPLSALGLALALGLLAGAVLPTDQPIRETDPTVASSPLDMSASLDSIDLI